MLDNFEMLYSCSEVYIRKFFETNKWMKSMFRDHKSSEYWLRELIPLQLRHRATICTEDAQLYQVTVNFNTTRKDIGEDKFTTRTTRFSTEGIIFLEHNTIMLGNVRLSQLVFSHEQVIHGKVGDQLLPSIIPFGRNVLLHGVDRTEIKYCIRLDYTILSN